MIYTFTLYIYSIYTIKKHKNLLFIRLRLKEFKADCGQHRVIESQYQGLQTGYKVRYRRCQRTFTVDGRQLVALPPHSFPFTIPSFDALVTCSTSTTQHCLTFRMLPSLQLCIHCFNNHSRSVVQYFCCYHDQALKNSQTS